MQTHLTLSRVVRKMVSGSQCSQHLYVSICLPNIVDKYTETSVIRYSAFRGEINTKWRTITVQLYGNIYSSVAQGMILVIDFRQILSGIAESSSFLRS